MKNSFMNTEETELKIASEPLASKYRPRTLDDFIGQEHLVGKNGVIRKFIERQQIPSMIFWGPPGTGKTTLAYIISQQLFYKFKRLLAVASGKSDLRKVVIEAMKDSKIGIKTILFLDEIHRWNKAQQDALLPYVEKGIITLIGATTENPSFTVNSALISRTKVFIFEPHKEEDIVNFLKKVVKQEYPFLKVSQKVLQKIAQYSNSDLRSALNILEMGVLLRETNKKNSLTTEIIENAVLKTLYHDKAGEQHYNIISAIHKSMRSSDPSASAYWTKRMLEAGDDPLYVARRMIRFASEDVGNADPQALILANTVYDACHKIGRPECDIFLIQLAIYMAKAPKDNSAYRAENAIKQDIQDYGNLPVPLHLRNAESVLMKRVGYGKGYIYDHDVKGKKSGQQCLPDVLKDKDYLA